MSQAKKSPSPSTPTPASGLSRRGFLGRLGGAAAVAAAGTLSYEAALGAPTTRGALPGGALGAGSLAPREVAPVLGEDRLAEAYQRRLLAAERMLARGTIEHPDNGDQARYPTHFATFSKGLPHNDGGEVVPAAFNALMTALGSGLAADFEAIPMGGERTLANPQAGLAFDTEGFDPQQFAIPPAPAFASAETAGEAVELYWMALLRDTPFTDYGSSPLVQAACDELTSLPAFKGPRAGGRVTPGTLFRDPLPGCNRGPYVSQFLLKPTPFGAEYIERRMRTAAVGSDHVMTWDFWLAVQNGEIPTGVRFDPARRYIRSGRDLANWVHVDILFQAYFTAALALAAPPDPGDMATRGGIDCPLSPGNPYLESSTQHGFGTWGTVAAKALLAEVSTRALKAIWFQKWYVHRRLRPETFGGRVYARMTGGKQYPIHESVLTSEALGRTHETRRTYLLPMAYPEGSPTHPSYGAGHATVAGACVTVLKAMFDESFEFPNPVLPRAGGQTLRPYEGGATLTVGGELNKLASNVATGRNIAGVHWRSDALAALRLGEEVALEMLREHLDTFHEGGRFELTKFDGEKVVIEG